MNLNPSLIILPYLLPKTKNKTKSYLCSYHTTVLLGSHLQEMQIHIHTENPPTNVHCSFICEQQSRAGFSAPLSCELLLTTKKTPKYPHTWVSSQGTVLTEKPITGCKMAQLVKHLAHR